MNSAPGSARCWSPAWRTASESAERAARISEALEQPGLGFVGTIHAFCARLLRERPVEAGIDPDFRRDRAGGGRASMADRVLARVYRRMYRRWPTPAWRP